MRALSVRRGAVFAVGPSSPQFACAQLGRVIQRFRPYFLTARFNESSLAFALPIFASPDAGPLADLTSWAFFPASHHTVAGVAWGKRRQS